MTQKELFLAALRGEEVDRVPVWLREGFPIVDGPADADDFTRGWQADPDYRALYEYVKPHVVAFSHWWVPSFNRMLMVPPKCVKTRTESVSGDLRRSHTRVETPSGELTAVSERRRGVATGWSIKPAVECVEDLLKLAEVPFEIDPAHIEQGIEHYEEAARRAGDRAVLRMSLPSPIVAISGTMCLELFLELSHTEKDLFHQLLEEITRRELEVLRAVFNRRELETVVNLGGSEQCTPPMMAPGAYEEYVEPYDGQIVDFLHEQGVLVNMHCHGKVSRALECMRRMGLDSTEPVEPPPAGDVTWEEAREIVDGEVTLIGNLEFDELESAEPERIRRRVREILSHGTRRVVLAASAGPISAVAPRLAANYRVWVDAAREFGG